MAYLIGQGWGINGRETPLGWNIKKEPRFFCESTISILRADEKNTTLKRRDEVIVDLGENCGVAK